VDEWLPVFALPNLALDEAIETTVAVLVPSHDTRVKGLREKHSSFD
jgi:hypothetical protein